MWLLEQKVRSDNVGYLVHDFYVNQSEVEPKPKTMQDYKEHLIKRRARKMSLKALEQAWWEYVDVLAEKRARFVLLREIAAVMERGIKNAEVQEGGCLIEKDRVDLLQKLIQKLNNLS